MRQTDGQPFPPGVVQFYAHLPSRATDHLLFSNQRFTRSKGNGSPLPPPSYLEAYRSSDNLLRSLAPWSDHSKGPVEDAARDFGHRNCVSSSQIARNDDSSQVAGVCGQGESNSKPLLRFPSQNNGLIIRVDGLPIGQCTQGGHQRSVWRENDSSNPPDLKWASPRIAPQVVGGG